MTTQAVSPEQPTPTGAFLRGRMKQIRDLMIDGQARIIDTIALRFAMKPLTVAARLRELRVFGYNVQKRHLGSKVFEYRVTV